MKQIGCILYFIFLVLLGLFIPCDPMYLFFPAIPVIAIPIYWIVMYFKPEWGERNWPYMSDEEKQKFLEEHKRKRKMK